MGLPRLAPRLSYLLPGLVFALLAGVLALYLAQVGGGKEISELPSALIDKPVPVFSLPPIDGRKGGFSSTDLTGRPLLVNVWASWCPPCRLEHPILMRLKGDGIPIYGINHKDKAPDAQGFLARFGNPYVAVGADRTGRISIEWGVYGYPETFIVGPAGNIHYRHVGPIMPRDLDEIILPKLRSLKK